MSKILIYTDGSARPNPGSGGWGFCCIVNEEEEYHGYGAAGNYVSNNTAEFRAVLEAIQFAVDKEMSHVEIHTDSKNTQRVFRHIREYHNRNYHRMDGTPLKNVDLYKRLYGLITDNDIKVDVLWVKGHSGVYGNEVADKLADRGVFCQGAGDYSVHIDYLNKNKVVTAAKDIPDDLHPMLTGKRLYFKTHTTSMLDNNYYIYASLSYPKYQVDKDRIRNKMERMKMENKMVGMRNSDNHYGILITKKEQPVLEEMKSLFDKLFLTRQAPCLLFIDRIRNKSSWIELNKGVPQFVGFNNGVLVNSHSEVFGYVVDPPRKVFSCEKPIEFSLTLYDWVKTGDSAVKTYDVLDYLFMDEKEGKNKWKIHNAIPQGEDAVFIDIADEKGDTITVQLNLGVDIPDRITLGRIAKNLTSKPVVKLLLWEIDEVSYRCGLLIEHDDDVLITFTDDANYRLMTRK